MTNFTDNQIQILEKGGIVYHINSVPFHATAEEWEEIDYIPQKREIVIYDEDDENSQPRMKLGDGENYVRDLAFFATASGEDSGDVTGGLAYELLWENNNVIDDNDQLVAFPLTNLPLSPDYDCYDVVLMRGLYNVTTIRVYHGTETTAERVVSAESGFGIQRRVVWYDEDQGKMIIDAGRVEVTDFRGGGGTEVDNTTLVPYKIYGVKMSFGLIETDKSEIVADVLAALPTWQGGSY